MTKRTGRGPRYVRAFNLHGINRVSGRARNANTRYVYALGPRIPPRTDERKIVALSRRVALCDPANL